MPRDFDLLVSCPHHSGTSGSCETSLDTLILRHAVHSAILDTGLNGFVLNLQRHDSGLGNKPHERDLERRLAWQSLRTSMCV